MLSVDQFLSEVKKQGRNIGSFKLGNVLVSIQDRYTKMEDHVAEIVAEHFPNVVETSIEYLFNQEILNRHIDIISDALLAVKGIPDEDKAMLIMRKEVISVKSGTIDTLATYGDQMPELFWAISPIISLKVLGK